MGTSYSVVCKNCMKRFTASYGGGFFFHLLHCEECGKERSVDFKEIGDLHIRFVKGLPGPFCVASSEWDKTIQDLPDIEPLDEGSYQNLIVERLERCSCGGRFTFDAPPKCPRCGSKEFEKPEYGAIMHYD
ncbi:MAG: hypothetical protein JW825_00575 [Candidatus Methanofastidiosa archaeon]|nr:hypothetical protein [Candidatus Methanofastidiosa archaeon]